MKQLYRSQIVCWIIICWLGNLVLVQAQTAPLIQWQQVIESGNLSATASVRAANASTGGHGILVDKQLIRLAKTGAIAWQKNVPGAYADSSNTRTLVQQTIAITPTQDGGFALLGLDAATHYYVTKVDSTGSNVWTKTIARTYTGSSAQTVESALTATPDGGFLVVGAYTDALSYLALTKLNAEGLITAQWRVKFAGPSQLVTPKIRQIVPLPGTGYLLVGGAVTRNGSDSNGLAIKLDAQNNVVWQKSYTQVYSLQSAVVDSRTTGVYTAVGTGVSKNSQVITIAPNQPNDGTVLADLPSMATVVSLVSDGTGAVTLLDANPANNGDFRLSSGKLPAAFSWTKNIGGSGADIPTDLLATDDGGYLVVGTTTSTNGDVIGKSTNAVAAWVLKLGNTSTTPLRLSVLSYDCQTGLLRFQANGGNSSPITYSTPGLARAQATDTFGTVDVSIRNGIKTITLQATQESQTVNHTFDIGVYCSSNSSPTSPDSLRLLAPTYNCQSGAFTFHTSGGNGATIEYAIAGIVEWTTNPNQVFGAAIRNAPSASPLLLMARQDGRLVTYQFDIRAVCGRARMVTTESSTELSVTLLGNPSRETAHVQLVGAKDQAVHFQLFDTSGRLVEQRVIEQATESERQTFDLRQQAVGTLLLHVRVNDQTRMVRLVKQ